MIANWMFAVLLAASPQHDADAAPAKSAASDSLAAVPYFYSLGVADGLPSNHVYKIVEDHKGYLWIGTHDGLARYDGTGFRVWRHDAADADSLGGNEVQAVHVDRDGRIWCGGEDGLSMFVEGKGGARDRFVHYRHDEKDPASLSSNDVWTIASDADGAIWTGGYGSGIDRLDPASGRIAHLRKQPGGDAGLASDNVLALTFDRAGRLWIGADTGVDVLARDGALRHVDLSAIAADARFNVTGLMEDADGGMLAATRHGLVRIGADLAARIVVDHGLSDSLAYSVIRDDPGELWIGTRHGLNRMDSSGRLHGYQENSAVPGSFPGTTVFDAMRDHEGGLWFATFEAGIVRVPPQWRNFVTYHHDPGDPASLSASHVQGLAEDPSGAVWAVNSNGGIDRLDPASGRAERAESRLPSPDKVLWSVLADRRGQLWVGHTRGLRVYDSGSGKFSDLPVDAARGDALAPGMVFLIVQAESGAIWAGSYGHAIQRIDPVTHAIERFDEQNAGLRNAEVDQIGFDRDGSLLIASGAGLDRFDTTVQHFSAVPGAPSARVLQFASANDGTLWLHLSGALEHYREQSGALTLIERVDAKSGWPALTVGGMAVDANGAVWVASARGLWRFDPATHAVRQFDARDGLGSAEFSRMPLLKRRDGSVFGGTLAGIVGFVPERVASIAVPPRLALAGVNVHREDSDVALDAGAGALTLQWGDRDLRVRAAALSFANPSQNRYQWKMSGIDTDWIDTGNRGEREYSQLAAGRHALMLRATNASGVWSEPALLHFEQPAPPWATRWAYAGYILAAALALLCALFFYRRRLKRRYAYQLAVQRREFAEAASAAKTDFLATMGHEIRTPMTGVLGMAELLLRTPLDGRQRGYAEAIQSSGQMMLRMVNDSLDLARIEAGKLELEEAPVDLPALLAEIDSLARPLAQKKGLPFETAITPDAPRRVCGDAVRIKQIVLNLVGNAIKFTERGHVKVELARAPDGAVEFRVRDTGPGIGESTRARLFQRFEQAQGTQRRHGGSGLGLAICRELVARMGGEIALDSVEGEGSTFRVVLPLRSVEDDTAIGAAPAASLAEAAHRRGLSLLLVEDDATVAAVIVGLLEALGHRVSHVEHSLAALAEVETGRFDAALLDLDLPGLDGLALAHTLRASEVRKALPRMPLIGISARSVGDEEALCRDAGMDAFLRKPILASALADQLRKLCG